MGTFTSAMAALLCGFSQTKERSTTFGLPGSRSPRTEATREPKRPGGFGDPPRVPILNVFERLQHFGDEVFPDLDEAGVLGLLQGVDQLSVGTLQVAFDHVVLEVVDGLRLVLHVVVAPARAGRLGIGSKRTM